MIEGMNTYFWEIIPNSAAIISTHPLASNAFENQDFAPISVYNCFPEKLDNASIFPYLLHEKQDEFSLFIKTWYKNSCAIVCYPPKGDPKIIGSGFLYNKNWVVTARHVYENLPENFGFFVRFFDYNVKRSNDSRFLIIQEHYIDRFVVHRGDAKYGLDIGLLALFPIYNNRFHQKFTKILPEMSSDSRLSNGTYCMFHFANGQHQVSVGEVINYQVQGANLSEAISIQAGPGASGAAIISESLGRISGNGISIYREIDYINHWAERRIIAFKEIFNPNPYTFAYSDKITAPYQNRNNRDILIEAIPSFEFDESGYEFLRWRDVAQVGSRMEHPQNPTFNEDNRCSYRDVIHCSNHHIIPIDDMIYLWDYLHNLEDETKSTIYYKAEKIVDNFKKSKRKEIYDGNNSVFAGLENAKDRKNRISYDLKKLKEDAEKLHKSEYKKLFDEELKRRYSEFYAVLAFLTLSQEDKGGPEGRSWFAWSWWNLFKGWNKDFRVDDPADSSNNDRSEKTKPINFNAQLWQCLKDENSGLYVSIGKLKKTKVRDEQIEGLVKNSLFRIKNAVQVNNIPPAVHPFIPDEWEEFGIKNKHPVYAVRKI